MLQLDVKPTARQTAAEKTSTHPCFACGAGTARIHLPVAPKCNIQCNYCVRKYDCPNESRPGVTTQILSPEQALERYQAAKKKVSNLTVVGIAGPGDALANFPEVEQTLQLIRKEEPDITFCLSTNGLRLPEYASRLVELGVTHVTVTINAVDAKIGAQIYQYVTWEGNRQTGEAAARILLHNQLEGLRYLVSHGVVCKVNIVVLKGINDQHIPTVVKKMRDIGVYMTNIMQLIPVEGSRFAEMPLVSNHEINELRKICSIDLKQMYHCRQCRADAVGTLDNDRSIEFGCGGCSSEDFEPTAVRVAVATKSGVLVDEHFGHANEFYIYESDGESARFVERRQVTQYCHGQDSCSGEERMEDIISAVSDCGCVLAVRIGYYPEKRLAEKGIRVLTTYDRIEDAILQVAVPVH